MSSHVFHDIYLHINWHTRGDHPFLKGKVEELAYAFLREKAKRMKGVRLHALGGTGTHVHLAVQIEPFVTVSELVQELKGASSYEVNRRMGHKALEWQRGYGVVSFGRKNLPWITEYVEHQPQHHAAVRVHRRLEAYQPDDSPTAKSG
jgi:putative transposase